VVAPPPDSGEQQGTTDTTPPTYSFTSFTIRDRFKERGESFISGFRTGGTTRLGVGVKFSEAIDEEQTTIRYRVGSGRERTFTFGKDNISGECGYIRFVGIYSCSYRPTAGEKGLFQVRVSAYKDTSGNAGAPGSYQTGWGIIVDTKAPAAPKLALKNPASSPSDDASPEFTATLSEGGGRLFVWRDRTHCGTDVAESSQHRHWTKEVNDSALPYTADIEVFIDLRGGGVDGAKTFHAVHMDEHFNVSPCSEAFTYFYDTTPPAAPGNFTVDRGPARARVTGGDTSPRETYATLTWDNPNDPGIAKYQYLQKEAGMGTVQAHNDNVRTTPTYEEENLPNLVDTAPCPGDKASGLARTDSCIVLKKLPPGTWTIEATTHAPAAAGSFTLKVSGLNRADTVPGPGAWDSCGEPIGGGNTSINQTWTAGCHSGKFYRGYARYYSFTTKAQTTNLVITLKSGDPKIDTYLYLHSGVTGIYPRWTDIPGSGPDTTSHKVTGLKHGYDYYFKLRALDTAGNEGPDDNRADANHAPQWGQGRNYRGDFTPYQYKTWGWSRAGVVLAETPFYDLDGDRLTYSPVQGGNTLKKDTDGRFHQDKDGGTFQLDRQGRIVTTDQTRRNLDKSGWQSVVLCVEAKDEHGAKTTRCFTMDFNDKNWPE